MRTDILERKSDILKWIEQRQSKAFMCRELRCKPSTLNDWLKRMGIIYKGNQGGKGIRSYRSRKTALEYIASGSYIYSYRLKKKLFEDGLKEKKCERCGLTVWMRAPIPLELHHIDGDKFNNALPNLEILCSNCHALTPNNSGKAIGKYKALAGVAER